MFDTILHLVRLAYYREWKCYGSFIKYVLNKLVDMLIYSRPIFFIGLTVKMWVYVSRTSKRKQVSDAVLPKIIENKKKNRY